jgi:hypothetical protein
MPMPADFRALVERFNQLGRLLPPRADVDDIDWSDADTRAGVEIVLAEMCDVKARIDAYLAALPKQ